MTSLKVSPPVLWLSGLGLISGLLSSIGFEAVEHIKVLGVPIYPGPLFGLVIAFGVYRWGKASWWAAVLALVVTVAAWIAAMRGFHAVTDDGDFIDTSNFGNILVLGDVYNMEADLSWR